MAHFNRQPTVAGPESESAGNQLFPVPLPHSEPVMQLVDLVGDAEVSAIESAGFLRFQATGDTGVGMTSAQPDVVSAMALEIKPNYPAQGPIFLLNLGDVIYGPGKKSLYSNNFYRPNMRYLHPAPGFDGIILAVPGNHDAEERDPADKSLDAFWENFCSPPEVEPPIAKSFGVNMPHQPGVYWQLKAPFLDLIALYSNAAEDFGLLGADEQDRHQRDWLHRTLEAIAAERNNQNRKALVLAIHHPPYSRALQSFGAGHPSSPELQQQLDEACAAAGIWPDAVLSGHSHYYQRFKRVCKSIRGREFETAYFVAGTGGMKVEPISHDFGTRLTELAEPGLARAEVSYENGSASNGYLRVSAGAAELDITFVQVTGMQSKDFETVTIDLASQLQVRR